MGWLGLAGLALAASGFAACSEGAASGGPTGESGQTGGAGAGGSGHLGDGGSQGGAGMSSAGAAGRPDACRIDLTTFENNGYRECPLTDGAALAGMCHPDVKGEYGTRETCGDYRIYAWGHDGRIGCAYAATSGELVGGFLWGLPVEGRDDCDATFVAGPPALANCPEPLTPWCRENDGQSSGGAAGAGGDAGAPSAGAAGHP